MLLRAAGHRTLLVLGVLATPAMGAYGQVSRAVHWSARATPTALRPGDTTRVALHATIAEFFHLYSTTQGPGGPVKTTVTLLPSKGWGQVGTLRVPPPDTIPDGNFGIMSEVYDDSLTIGLTIKATLGAAGVAEPARIAVRHQSCTTRYCLPPRTDTVVVPVKITGSSPSIMPGATKSPLAAITDAPTTFDESTTEIEAYGRAGGMGAFLLLAASMGALALLTPCVFPMVPITVTSFLAVAGDRRRGIRQAGLYALGIIGSFTVLGVLTAVVFGAAGLARFSASPVVNLLIALLFATFALSLFGAVPLRLPSGLVNRAASLKLGGDTTAAMFMGVVFTLTAFTCTAPFIGTLLVMSAQGAWTTPLIGMLVFSTVFAAPFFGLALVPGLLRRQPRAGEWMPTLEMIVGAIELAAAIKFASNADLVLGWGLLTRRTVIGAWIVILIALAFALLRWFPYRAVERRGRPGRLRLATAGVTLALLAVLVPGLVGRRLGELDAFLPPMQSGIYDPVASTAELPWMHNNYRGALLAASRERRPILIDFTGYTCTNCRWMEANMFPRADVKRALERFVRLRLYTDGLGEPYASQQLLEQQMFKTVALPLYAILDPDGKPRATFLGMTRDAREFTRFLTEASGQAAP